MKMNRYLLLALLGSACISLFLPFFTFAELTLSIPGLLRGEFLSLSYPVLAYGLGAHLVLISFGLALLNKDGILIFANVLSAFILFQYIGNVISAFEGPLLFNRGIGAQLLNISLLSSMGLSLLSLIKRVQRPYRMKAAK